MGLCNVLRDRKQLRHRFPWLAGVVLIQTSDDYTDAASREIISYGNEFVIEKLTFVYADDFSVGLKLSQQVSNVGYVRRLVSHLRVRNDVIVRVTGINDGFKNLDLLARNLGTT